MRSIRPAVLACLTLIGAGVLYADQPPKEITFEPEEGETILGFARGTSEAQLLESYVTDLGDTQTRLVVVYTSALANFETAIRSASSKEAKADILDAVFKGVLKGVVDEVAGKLGHLAPAVSTVIAVWENVTGEVERAAKAKDSYEVGVWIRNQRTHLVDTYAQGPKPGTIRQALLREYQAAADDAERNDFLVRVDDAEKRLRDGIVPQVGEVERRLYEAWINAQWGGRSGDQGYLELRFEDDGSVNRALVKAPFGDQIADALNGMLAQGTPKRIVDLKVRKAVCFYVENLVPGGHEWSCTWVDPDGTAYGCVLPNACEAFRSVHWQDANKFAD